MTRALLIFILGLNTAIAFAAQRVTVDQLSRVITSSRKKADKKIADRLYDLELTQRLSAKNLAAFEAELPGPESRRALVALADQAIFLDPPPAEIPDVAPPSIEEQRAMVAKAIDDVKATLHRLPDLFARRDTIRYEDSPPVLQTGNVDSQSGNFVAYQPLHPVSRSIATVLYRDGHEVVQTGAEQQGGVNPAASGLRTIGEFGPILATVFGDAAHGKLAWSHWEKGASGNVAVFGFEVPKGASHYQVRFCCVAHRVFEQFAAYHGEFTVEPATGNILRLTLIADMSREDPIAKAELMVEYGPVELGAETYYCPIRSVSVSVAPVQIGQQTMMSPGMWGRSPTEINDPTHAPLQTMLNETVFDRYHLFRADVQIVTAGNAQGGSGQSTAKAGPEAAQNATAEKEQPVFTNQNPPVGAVSAGVNTSSEEPKAVTEDAASTPDVKQRGAVAAAPATGTSSAPPVTSSATAPAPTAVSPGAPPSTPEMTVAAAGDIPQSPSAHANGFSLRVNTRLVDVDVTAYDKKGRPVTDLTSQDFVIYDNGRRQSVRSFSHVSGSSVVAEGLPAAAEPVQYSNRLEAVGGEKSGNASAPVSSTILLLDATSLDFADLTFARQQILKFLGRLPGNEPVGLYVRTGSAFRILKEETADHEAVSAALKSWVPTAPGLALAQEAERRNRQQFDTVDSPADMQSVNGNVPGMVTPDTPSASSSTLMDIPGGGGNTTMDPKLMKEGKNPVREALSALTTIAAHMNAIPGHKDLVWVASDNVLANWTDQAAGTDKGPHSIGRYAIDAQEALNDAHVSLYPLDASQLGTAATDASLQNNSVQLNPAVSGLYPNEGAVDQMTGARNSAEMRQNMRAVQPAMQHLAQATGGTTFQRTGDLVADLNSVVADGNAAYLLSFAPDTQPDGQYHRITVEVPSRRGIRLRYRAGYLYTKEPASLKDRLREAIWQPRDETEIALSAHWNRASEGSAVSLRIGAGDIDLSETGGRWTDKLDIFLVQKDETGIHATVKGQTLALNLKPDTYEKVLHEGIPFAEYVQGKGPVGNVRVIVVDENSGRMGSITLPGPAERASR
jgi:VWFA-related protein